MHNKLKRALCSSVPVCMFVDTIHSYCTYIMLQKIEKEKLFELHLFLSGRTYSGENKTLECWCSNNKLHKQTRQEHIILLLFSE